MCELMVVQVLKMSNHFDGYVLEKCGHSPFMEKYAKDELIGCRWISFSEVS